MARSPPTFSNRPSVRSCCAPAAATRDPWEGLDYESINAVFAELEERCVAAMEQSGFSRAELQLARTIDMRYRRQTHDLMVPVPDGPVTAAVARKLVELFEESYEAVYGKGAGFRFAGIELTTFRVVAVGRTRKPSIRKPSATQRAEAGTPPHFRTDDARLDRRRHLPVAGHAGRIPRQRPGRGRASGNHGLCRARPDRAARRRRQSFHRSHLAHVLEKWEPVSDRPCAKQRAERAMNTPRITDHPAAARRSIRSPSR